MDWLPLREDRQLARLAPPCPKSCSSFDRVMFSPVDIVSWTDQTARAFNAFLRAYEKGLLIRTTGDIIALSPPLIVEKSHIDQIFSMLADILKNLD